jgi:bilirubin oxidase
MKGVRSTLRHLRAPLVDRRTFLRGLGAGVAGLVVGCGRQSDGGESTTSLPEAVSPQLVPGQPLPALPILRNESAGDVSHFVATLVASRDDVAVHAGRMTSLARYDHHSPGPLIELVEGQHVRIELDNRLAQATTVHWHGLPVPADQDGNPMDPVAAGTKHVYEFDVPAGTAGTYWYHPHPHDATASQVAEGLAAPLVVRAADDPLAHVPEVLMFITGIALDANAQIAADDAIDWTIGRQRDLLLVNGARLPVHAVAPGATQRWRIVNATAAIHLKLALEGHTFTLVGTDGGLLGEPIEDLTEFLLAPAQRVELIVKANAAPNGRYRLRALRYATDFMGVGTYVDQDVLTLATTNALPAAPVTLPPKLRPIADLGPATARVDISFDEADLCTSKGAKRTFLINGRMFDMNRVDVVSEVGRVELWNVVNNTTMSHPFHIHGTQFQLVSRTFGTETTATPYLAWVDTVLVPPGQTATLKVKQTLPGKRMFHCHILQHEDNCMMAIVDVRAPAA